MSSIVTLAQKYVVKSHTWHQNTTSLRTQEYEISFKYNEVLKDKLFYYWLYVSY